MFSFLFDAAPPSGFFLGPVRIQLYGLMIALAALAGWFVAVKFAPRFGIEKKDVDNVLVWVVIGGLFGARVYFVAFEWDYFQNHLTEAWQIWQGGLSIFGAILGGSLAGFLYARKRAIRLLGFLDLGFLALPLSQSIGRWGNFFNQEAYGAPTDLPWRMFVEPGRRLPGFEDYSFFHPAFLYESLWDLAVFAILLYLTRSGARISPGLIAGYYLTLYPLGRFFIESLRLDSFLAGAVKVDQVAALAMMACGVLIISVIHAKHYKTNG